MSILVQFLLRLSFGLTLSMALTPSRKVTSGFYRNHSYVALGLCSLASLVAFRRPDVMPLWPPLAAAILSYISAVCWLYEKPRPGIVALVAVSGLSLTGMWMAAAMAENSPFAASPVWMTDFSVGDTVSRVPGLAWLFAALDPLSSGWLLGTVITAMFLGHWYLNTPTMQLDPLRRLVQLSASAVVLRTVSCATALLCELGLGSLHGEWSWTLLALRWGAGLLGTGIVVWMTWQTLKVPNTQSATGILYVGVMFTFLGELAALLLSADSRFPL